MGKVQLNKNFNDEEIGKLVAFLESLTGEYKGEPLTEPVVKIINNPDYKVD